MARGSWCFSIHCRAGRGLEYGCVTKRSRGLTALKPTVFCTEPNFDFSKELLVVILLVDGTRRHMKRKQLVN